SAARGDENSLGRMVRSALDRVKPRRARAPPRRPTRPALPLLRSGGRRDRPDPLTRALSASGRPRGRGLDRVGVRLRPGRDDPLLGRPDPGSARSAPGRKARPDRRLPPVRPGRARGIPAPLPLLARRLGAPLRDRAGARGGRIGARLLRTGVSGGGERRRRASLAGDAPDSRVRLAARDPPANAAGTLRDPVLLPGPGVRVGVQALEPLSPLDGPERRARLRTLARDSGEPARYPERSEGSLGRMRARSLLTVATAVALAVVGTLWIRSLVPPESPTGSLAFLSAARELPIYDRSGGKIDLAREKGRFIIVHFWAT